jgi:hypothetical protein
MPQQYNYGRGRSKVLSRRAFLAGAATAAASIVAGCQDLVRPTPTPTVALPGRDEILQFHPQAKSRVVVVRHAGVWSGEELLGDALERMLNASITQLTGIHDAVAAWQVLFDPGEVIGLKTNAISTFDVTHPPLVLALAERLKAAGIPPESIIIFDRRSDELQAAGYPMNKDGSGVRCYGSDGAYSGPEHQVAKGRVRFSEVLLKCDAIINIPAVRMHSMAGITCAMKNHFGCIDRPASLHYPARCDPAIPELNALPEIRERSRLIVADGLRNVPFVENTLVVGVDPVACDSVGLKELTKLGEERGADMRFITGKATHIATASEMGLGTDDAANMDLQEIELG